jgi:DNA-binding XRE family transcriptional regulator
MATKQMKRKPQPQEDITRRALTMALGIVVERIQNLPKEDRDDLGELMKELVNADDGDELNGIIATMEEIFDREPIRFEKMDLSDELQDGELHKWIDFVGARIKELRVNANLTQDELAELSGLPQSHISRLESGKHSPSHLTLEKLAQALKVGMEVFDFSV